MSDFCNRLMRKPRWLLEERERTRKVIRPERDPDRVCRRWRGGPMNRRQIDNTYISREQHPGGGIKPPFIARFIAIDRRNLIIEAPRQVHDDWLQIQVMVGDVDGNNPARFHVLLIHF